MDGARWTCRPPSSSLPPFFLPLARSSDHFVCKGTREPAATRAVRSARWKRGRRWHDVSPAERSEGRDRCHGSKNDDGLIALRSDFPIVSRWTTVARCNSQAGSHASEQAGVVAWLPSPPPRRGLSLSGHWCGDRGPEKAVSAGVSTLFLRSCRAPEHVGRHRHAAVVLLDVVVGVFVVFPPHFRLSTLSPLVYSPRLVRFPRFFRQSVAAGKAARPVAAAARQQQHASERGAAIQG